MTEGPRVERVRHELTRRRLQVKRIERIAPVLTRVVLGGPELQGFTSLGFDDHVKLIFPGGAGDAPPPMRDFTPRRHDAARGELAVDFFVHDAGPATEWARQAKVGDDLIVAGPKGSAVISVEGIDRHVLVGDETAVPAIARRLEELPAGAEVMVLVESDSASPWIDLPSAARTQIRYVARSGGAADAPGAELIAALRTLGELPARTFFWIAAESRVARALRRHLREERGVDLAWIKASGYWQRGATGSHEKIADDAPG